MSNTFGNIFKITTFGESHGKIMGVVIDGCPSNIEISEEEIENILKKRRPNRSEFVTSRAEQDSSKIVSGVFEGKTTGAPICIIIENKDVKSKEYDPIKDFLRPSHANYSYLSKYGIFDYRGASRASARETALRIAAGAIAKKVLKKENIKVFSYLNTLGDISLEDSFINNIDNELIYEKVDESSIFCPCKKTEEKMVMKLRETIENKDSIGGKVKFIIKNVPKGLGEPIYDKLSARLSFAMMSIPSVKGFEIGDGFESIKKNGSNRNDLYDVIKGKIVTKTNNEGGILAGISNGNDIIGAVAFKPTATIGKPLETLDTKKNKKTLLIKSNRHDICTAIRGVKVVEAMCYLVLVDFYLLNKVRNSKNLNFENFDALK